MTAESLRAALVEELATHKWLTTEQWRVAFDAVPRHVFLTRFLPSPQTARTTKPWTSPTLIG